MKKNHYEILGLPRDATVQQIKKRYRQLVRQHHPDVAEDKAAANAAFIEISEAYQTLVNQNKRVIYDVSLDAEEFRVNTKRPAPPRPKPPPAPEVRQPERSRWESGGDKRATLKIGLNLIGLSFVVLAFVILGINPGEPKNWLAQSIPFVNTWSMTLIAVLLITGVITGFLLSVSEVVQSLDDELVFPSVRAHGHRTVSYPVALILMVFNLFSFYLAVGVYTIIGLIQGSLSKSVLSAFLATFFVVLLASVVYQPGSVQVLKFGGNVVFPAVLFGWAIGDMFRPGF